MIRPFGIREASEGFHGTRAAANHEGEAVADRRGRRLHQAGRTARIFGSLGAVWPAFLFCVLWTVFSAGADPLPAAESPSTATRVRIGGAANGWVRAGRDTNAPTWGIRGGLIWGLPSPQVRNDGPRGLIRLYYPVLTNNGYDLINFIAIEPVVQNRKSFSELERSSLDSAPGKRLWTYSVEGTAKLPAEPDGGRVISMEGGRERLVVEVGVERFDNGARVRLTVAQDKDAPDEIEFTVHAEPDSAPMEYCILTATMGNKARTREVWLKDGPVRSLALYPDYRGTDFARHHFFGLDRLLRTPMGDVLVALTTDEKAPWLVDPYPERKHWRYAGVPATQYWRKPAGTWRDDLHVAVNGRHTYWLSRQPIPGGIAYENFEMRERFRDGQRSRFGITRQTPASLGFPIPSAQRPR